MDSKKLLSKNLLQMKFMQRTKEKVDRIEEEEKTAHLLEKVEAPVLTIRDQIIVEPSYVECEQLVFGRMSFKGYNPEIEKLMSDKQPVETRQEKEQQEVEVTRTEMVHRHRNYDRSNRRDSRGRGRGKRQRYSRPVD